MLNINVPPGGSAIKGARATRLGTRRYRNSFDRRIDPRGMIYYWLAGELIEGEEEENSDVQAIRDGYISITPVHFNLTNEAIIPDLQKMLSRIKKGMIGEHAGTESTPPNLKSKNSGTRFSILK